MPDLTLDLRNLRCALVAAERGSFRRAAGELGLQQSTVSRRVQLLERRLGASIFERHTGGVRLTGAGANFLREAAAGADSFRRAVQAFTSVTRGSRGQLRIGLFVSLATNFLASVIEKYRSLHEGVHVQFEESTAERTISRVVSGHIDIGFLTGVPRVEGCEVLELWHQDIFVALPSAHPLAAKRDLTWEDVRRERFIIGTGGPGPEIQDYLIKHLSGIGFHPDIRSHDVGIENLMIMVACGLGLTLSAASTDRTTFSGLAFRPIAGNTEVLPCSAIWSPRNSNPALRQFLTVARAAA
ncbi:MAG: LysR family transcriptional regulator [Alphaproteobacteria bacterium]|nr:LysR family transcriptional regulator [Alphaproteobacteria bacterium]